MSVKKEPSGRRSIQVEVEVPGTPEQVWNAIATGPGISSWFVPTDVEGREGGKVIAHFGPGMDSEAAITAWEPPHRFSADSRGWAPNSPPIATEWTVEARDGGTCVVRVVHSLFASTDDWDDQLSGTESGWPAFFRILRLYLTHFAGEPCSTFQATGMAAVAASEGWESLAGSLGLLGAEVGQQRSAPAGVPAFRGTIDAIRAGDDPYALLILDEPARGAAMVTMCGAGNQALTSICFYLFGDRAAAAATREQPQWQAWVARQIAAASSGS